MKKVMCAVLAILIVFGNSTVGYAEQTFVTCGSNHVAEYTTRATRYFSLGVKANGRSMVSQELSVDAGETIQINATYSPANAEIQIGIVDENGQFRFVRVTGGIVNITIGISERGNYRLAVKNDSENAVSISGYVYY